MGKDGSGEPATKKFKQSQLCFKSPKSNNNLKSKLANGSNQEICSKSPIVVPTDSNDIDSQINICSGNANTDNTTLVNKNISSTDKNVNANSKTDSEIAYKSSNDNISVVVNDAPALSTNDKSEKNDLKLDDDIIRMDVDEASPHHDNLKAVASVTTASQLLSKPNGDGNTSQSIQSDAATPATNNANIGENTLLSPSGESVETDEHMDDENESTSPKSSKADLSVSSKNGLSSPKSVMSFSSDTEDVGEDKTNSSSSTPVTPVTPKMVRQMTPKMLKRHEESLKKKQLQQQLKEEKHALKEKMRKEKMKQKMEEEEKKKQLKEEEVEKKKQLKEEEIEKKKQLKEEKIKKRLAEVELKNEEKRQKQEDKKAKEEEKKKKKELKLEEQKKDELKKDKEVRRKERTQAAFVSFFKKQPQSPGSSQAIPAVTISADENPTSPIFMPFPMKNDMRLAAVVRRELDDDCKKQLDEVLADKKVLDTYINSLKKGNYSARSTLPTWPPPSSEELHDCIIIEAQVEETGGDSGIPGTDDGRKKSSYRAKLLQFCENRRPAYFGTWTKSSKEISGRRPFIKDTKGILDYEVDSDSDWEEEEEGEDLENLKDDETEGQEEEVTGGENGYLLDNTFVPHGYLSDEEQPEDEELQESVEKQKDRLVALREEFDEEMKQGGAQALKPRLLGCLWMSNSTTQVSKGSLYEVLLGHRAVWDESAGKIQVEGEPTQSESSPNSTQTPPKKQIPPIVLQEIAQMVDGSRWPLNKLVREVGEVLAIARPQNPVSRLALTRSIKQMASKTLGFSKLDSKENYVWTVKPEFRSQFNLQEIEVSTPDEVTTPESRVKSKETLLDSFLKGQQPPAKKRISLTPISDIKENDAKMSVTPETKKPADVVVAKKKVSFVTLPPRTPDNKSNYSNIPQTPNFWSSKKDQITIKPHVDTPRPTLNKFLNKDKQTSTPTAEITQISDDSH